MTESRWLNEWKAYFQCVVDKSLKAAHRNSLVYTKLKFTKQIKKTEKSFMNKTKIGEHDWKIDNDKINFFVIVNFFRSNSNRFSVILIWSSELASYFGMLFWHFYSKFILLISILYGIPHASKGPNRSSWKKTFHPCERMDK